MPYDVYPPCTAVPEWSRQRHGAHVTFLFSTTVTVTDDPLLQNASAGQQRTVSDTCCTRAQPTGSHGRHALLLPLVVSHDEGQEFAGPLPTVQPPLLPSVVEVARLKLPPQQPVSLKGATMEPHMVKSFDVSLNTKEPTEEHTGTFASYILCVPSER